MKKGILLLVAFISFGFFAQAQTITKKDAKKISQEINKNVKQLEKAIDKTDWKEVNRVVNKTADALEDNMDGLAQIIENIDLGQFLITMNKLAKEVEGNIDSKELEKSIEKMSKRMEKAIKNMVKDSK